MRNLFSHKALGLLLIFLAVLAAWLNFLYSPLINDDQGYKYTVPHGASFRSVSDDLYAKKIVTQRIFFNVLIRLRRDNRELKAGQYFFQKGTTPSKMLEQMASGNGILYHTFVIVPGWNFKQLTAALLQENSLNHKLAALTDTQLMTLLNHPELNPEGQFLPETYFFVEGSSDTAILKRAFKAMQEKLNIAWEQRANGLPFKNPYEVLIAASLVEKEAYLAAERPIIAGVLVNRLRRNMLLQFDPTVIYGLGPRYDGVIHKDDLLQDTPYNSYLHKGLPPTPIAMPSFDAIKAVTHPDQNDYIYFVARNRGGSHQFSRTLEEHHTAVEAAEKVFPWFFNTELVRHYFLSVSRLQDHHYFLSVSRLQDHH
jgi:peptidoglycan lytic transglycosylase G